MNVLVLGSRGQVGSDVLEAGEASRILEVKGLDRSTLDLEEVDAIHDRLEAFHFDVLVNCAAYTQVDAAERETTRAFEVNAHAVDTLAGVCAERGALFVHLSTDYVFDGQSHRPYRPGDPPAPLNVYGASKLVGEALARRVLPDRTVIIRTSSVFGIAGTRQGGGGNFVETMLRLARERPTLRVVADNQMAPTFSWDLAHALVRLLEGSLLPGTYHLTNSGSASPYDLAVATLELIGADTKVEPIPASEYPSPARRPAFSVLDTSQATALCGSLPHWRDALGRYLKHRSSGEHSSGTRPT